MSGAYGLVLPFDTDDPEFVRGVECGRLWERMETIDAQETDFPLGLEIVQIIHGTNAEMVMRMCEVKGWNHEARVLGDGHWIEVHLRQAVREEADRG
jgi:hypothetical protein